MSLKANLAVIVQLHDFKNLNLPHKARYALEVHLYQGKSAKNVAMPFNILETQRKFKKNVSREGHIDDQYFRSRRFNIEFQDQDIDLNDACEFRMNLQGFPTLEDGQLFLQFVLLQNIQCYFREDMEEDVQFKEAERYRFKLENIESGIIRYCQGQFSQTYISSFSFSLFLMVTDYRFHPYTNAHSESQKEKSRQKVEDINHLMQWSKKYLKNCQEPESYFYRKYIKDLCYNSMLLRSEVNGILRQGEKQLKLYTPTGPKGTLVPANEKQFFDYITHFQPEVVNDSTIKAQIYRINEENYFFVQEMSKNICNGNLDYKLLKERFRNQKRDMFGERVLRNLVFGDERQPKDLAGKLASKLRKKKEIGQMKIIDEHLFLKPENHHYMLLEVNLPHSLRTKEYSESPIQQVLKQLSELRRAELRESKSYDERNMVVVFCHGFQASSFDMEMLKRQIGKALPVSLIMLSTANEMSTDGDIGSMGLRLADEIRIYLAKHFQDPSDAILNFVGHSMGGIIARASLQHLRDLKTQFGFFFSLSSPHIGYLSGVDTMVKTGLWVMRKMNKVLSLDQLSMEDTEQLKDSFLYRLSSSGHLRDFQKVIFLSCSEDSYVPWLSARGCASSSTGSRGRIQRQMVENMLGQRIVHRIDVHFGLESTKDLDTFIGRAAHILLLTQDTLLKLINESIPTLFDPRQL